MKVSVIFFVVKTLSILFGMKSELSPHMKQSYSLIRSTQFTVLVCYISQWNTTWYVCLSTWDYTRVFNKGFQDN